MRVRPKRRSTLVIMAVSNVLLRLLVESRGWLIFPLLPVLAVFLLVSWVHQAACGKPYRNRIVRAYGRLGTWKTIRQIEARYATSSLQPLSSSL